MIATSTTFQLTIRSRRWRRRADMHQARACHGCAILNDNILVIGGRDNTGMILATAELYDPVRDQWTLIKSIPEPVFGVGTTYLDGFVWAIGGVTTDGRRSYVSDRVYCFDPYQQNWFRKPHLPEPRAFSCCATLRREIWLFGGVKDSVSEDGYLASSGIVFVLSPEVGRWEQHITLPTPKHAMAIAKAGRRVYILGGMTSVTKESLTENDMYDREHDVLRDGAALPRPLTGAAAVGLPIDYMARNENKWIGVSPDQETLNYLATKIQSLYRGYYTRKTMKTNRNSRYGYKSGNELDNLGSGGMHSGYFGYNGQTQLDDHWKAMPSVSIPEWPPRPNPNSSSSTINMALGALPPGYTTIPVPAGKGTLVRRYIPLLPHLDPNLGMVGYLDDAYKKAKKVLGLRRVDPLPAFAHNMRSVERLQDDSIPVVLIMGGLHPRDPLNYSYGKTVLRYHPLKDRWEFVGLMPEPRNHHASVILHEVVYVTGGYDPDMRNSGEMVATRTTFAMDIHTAEWVQKADMNCARSHHGTVVFRGKVYAVGGRDSNGRLVASIEEFLPDENKWQLLRPMLTPRMGMACAVYEGSIWCLGGIGGSDDEEGGYPVLASAVSYDPISDMWSARPPLRCPRAFGTAMVIDKKLWLSGGCYLPHGTEKNSLVSIGGIDCYNAEEAEWQRRVLITNPRHCAATVAVESCIYMFGGISSQEWSALIRNEMIITTDNFVDSCRDFPVSLTGIAAVTIPPVSPALRASSLSCLLHRKLTV